jgi:seryl-tRNA synthetase
VLDLKFVVENPDRVLERMAVRGLDEDQLLGGGDPWALDRDRRALLQKVEDLRHKQRLAGEEIARLGKAKQDASALKGEMKGVSDEIKSLEARQQEVEPALRDTLLGWPNLPDDSVPIGGPAGGRAAPLRLRAQGSLGSGP